MEKICLSRDFLRFENNMVYWAFLSCKNCHEERITLGRRRSRAYHGDKQSLIAYEYANVWIWDRYHAQADLNPRKRTERETAPDVGSFLASLVRSWHPENFNLLAK